MFLHDRGIVHRDLKPANVFRERPRQPVTWLSKFITPAAAASDGVGTVPHGPEVARGKYGSESTSQPGVMLYEMIAGPSLFGEHGKILMKHLTEPPIFNPAQFRRSSGALKGPQRRTPGGQLLDEFRRARHGKPVAEEIPDSHSRVPLERNDAETNVANGGRIPAAFVRADVGRWQDAGRPLSALTNSAVATPALAPSLRVLPDSNGGCGRFAASLAGCRHRLRGAGIVDSGACPKAGMGDGVHGDARPGGGQPAGVPGGDVAWRGNRVRGAPLEIARSLIPPAETGRRCAPVVSPLSAQTHRPPEARIVTTPGDARHMPQHFLRTRHDLPDHDDGGRECSPRPWRALRPSVSRFSTTISCPTLGAPAYPAGSALFGLPCSDRGRFSWQASSGKEGIDNRQRADRTALGAAVGACAFWLHQTRLISAITFVSNSGVGGFDLLTDSPPVQRRWPPTSFISRSFDPSLVVAGRLFPLQSPDRLGVFTGLVAFLVPAAFVLGLGRSVGSGNATVVQLSAPWVPVKDRSKLVPGAIAGAKSQTA